MRPSAPAVHPLTPVRRRLVVATPMIVPLSMWLVFRVLSRRLPAREAYNLGFACYWGGWCLGFPVWVLSPRRAYRVLRTGRRPTVTERILLLLPVVGGAATQLIPQRGNLDPKVVAVMASTAVLNAAGEELLWRGLFLEAFPTDPVRGALWPLLGFTFWHLAPQCILPPRAGRWQFLLGAAAVGAASTITARRGRGLRAVVLPHVATDACGVNAARFRLGMTTP